MTRAFCIDSGWQIGRDGPTSCQQCMLDALPHLLFLLWAGPHLHHTRRWGKTVTRHSLNPETLCWVRTAQGVLLGLAVLPPINLGVHLHDPEFPHDQAGAFIIACFIATGAWLMALWLLRVETQLLHGPSWLLKSYWGLTLVAGGFMLATTRASVFKTTDDDLGEEEVWDPTTMALRLVGFLGDAALLLMIVFSTLENDPVATSFSLFSEDSLGPSPEEQLEYEKGGLGVEAPPAVWSPQSSLLPAATPVGAAIAAGGVGGGGAAADGGVREQAVHAALTWGSLLPCCCHPLSTSAARGSRRDDLEQPLLEEEDPGVGQGDSGGGLSSAAWGWQQAEGVRRSWHQKAAKLPYEPLPNTHRDRSKSSGPLGRSAGSSGGGSGGWLPFQACINGMEEERGVAGTDEGSFAGAAPTVVASPLPAPRIRGSSTSLPPAPLSVAAPTSGNVSLFSASVTKWQLRSCQDGRVVAASSALLASPTDAASGSSSPAAASHRASRSPGAATAVAGAPAFSAASSGGATRSDEELVWDGPDTVEVWFEMAVRCEQGSGELDWWKQRHGAGGGVPSWSVHVTAEDVLDLHRMLCARFGAAASQRLRRPVLRSRAASGDSSGSSVGAAAASGLALTHGDLRRDARSVSCYVRQVLATRQLYCSEVEAFLQVPSTGAARRGVLGGSALSSLEDAGLLQQSRSALAGSPTGETRSVGSDEHDHGVVRASVWKGAVASGGGPAGSSWSGNGGSRPRRSARRGGGGGSGGESALSTRSLLQELADGTLAPSTEADVLNQVATRLRRAVPLSNVDVRLQTFRGVVSGAQIIKWLKTKESLDHHQAIAVAQAILDAGMIKVVLAGNLTIAAHAARAASKSPELNTAERPSTGSSPGRPSHAQQSPARSSQSGPSSASPTAAAGAGAVATGVLAGGLLGGPLGSLMGGAVVGAAGAVATTSGGSWRDSDASQCSEGSEDQGSTSVANNTFSDGPGWLYRYSGKAAWREWSKATFQVANFSDPSIHATAEHFRERDGEDGLPFVEYLVKVRTSDSQWEVWRRFREFDAMHQGLVQLELEPTVAFPRKGRFVVHDTDFMLKRWKGLKAYLESAVAVAFESPEVAGPVVMEFLDPQQAELQVFEDDDPWGAQAQADAEERQSMACPPESTSEPERLSV